jgi:predicted 3-demethylubiquinone-9 3-methyltransferase (glyoxalase superfamily)
MQKVTPFLWFDTQAEEAAKFYVSVFKNAEMGIVTHYGEAGPGPKGSVMTVTFKLDGVEFVALNGGPQYKFTEAVSLVVNCKNQQEVDDYWEKLTAGGGAPGPCGWLKDKFGLSWQVVPEGLADVLKSQKAMKAMMQMGKLDLTKLREAAKS